MSNANLTAAAPKTGLVRIESGLEEFLRNDVALSRLVHGRIHPGKAPSGTAFPQLTYSCLDDDDVTCQSGNKNINKARLEIVCWDREPDLRNPRPPGAYDTVKAVAQCVGTATGGTVGVAIYGFDTLDGFRGTWLGRWKIHGFFVQTHRDDHSAPLDSSDRGLQMVILECDCHYSTL